MNLAIWSETGLARVLLNRGENQPATMVTRRVDENNPEMIRIRGALRQIETALKNPETMPRVKKVYLEDA